VLPIVAINKHTGRSETLPEVGDARILDRRRRRRPDTGFAHGVAKTLDVVARGDGDWGVMKEKIRAI